MTETVKNINIDVQKKRAGEAVVAKQGDVKSRFLRVTVCSGGTKITVAQDATAVINASRSDGASKSFFCTVNGDGTVTAPLTGWMLECAGVLRCSVSVLGGDGERLTSTTFFVDVEPAEVTDGDIEHDESVDVLAELVVECREAADAAGAAASAANGAAASANEAAGAALSAAGAANEAATSANSAAASARAVADSKLDKSAVVQEAGEGSDVVMSQGAVTEAISGKAADRLTSELPINAQESGIYSYENPGVKYIDDNRYSDFSAIFHNHHRQTPTGYGTNIVVPYSGGGFSGAYVENFKAYNNTRAITKLLSERDIVQETGKSESLVMSQGAVAKAIKEGDTQGVNLFGFNKGIRLLLGEGGFDKAINGVQITRTAGGASTGTGGVFRLQNLGFDGVPGWYTMSGEIYATEDVDVAIDILDVKGQIVNVTATPQRFVVQSDITEQLSRQPWAGMPGGFVDFEKPKDDGITVYVKNLKIERGKVDDPVWTPAPEDIVTEWSGAGFHNSIFRGKYLGDAVTDAQYAAINAGAFDDMYVGDYWTINGVNWLIAGFDYLYNTGDTALTKHHAVIIPEKCLYNAKMNDTNTTEGGYALSQMRTQNLEQAEETINAAFPDHVLTYRALLVNAVTDGHPSGFIWENCSVELMTEIMCYGTNIYASVANNGVTVPAVYTMFKTQLSIFRMAPDLITMREYSIWLQDVCSSGSFCFTNNDGGACNAGAGGFRGVRPFFLIGG